MPLDPNRFTRKTQEAFGAAQARARDTGNTEVSSLHLLRALLDQPEGVVTGVIERIGVDLAALRRDVDGELDQAPRVSGATVRDAQLAAEAFRVLEEADKERAGLDDEYLSTEHILLAMTNVPGGVGDRLRAAGVSHDAVLDALKQVRGSHRVTSDNPEEQYQALEKYGRDLTDAARDGKIDPVIGRDDEIRRIIQVLSAPHEEQPRADRRARCRQDRDRRGSGPPHRRGRRAGRAAQQACRRARHRFDGRGRQVPRRVRGAVQGRPQGDRGFRRARSSRSSTSCTRSSARAVPRARSTPAT